MKRNKKMSEEKKVIVDAKINSYLTQLKVKCHPRTIDDRYQTILKELKEVNNDSLTIDQFNELIKLDVLGLMKLYQGQHINYISMYNLLIKVIGYNFMFEELLNRKIDVEVSFNHWYDNICNDKDMVVDELNSEYIKYCDENKLEVLWQTTQE